MTSQRYTDLTAIEITNSDFLNGSLTKTSYARPAKSFTANAGIIRKQIGELTDTKFDEIRRAVTALFDGGLNP